MEFSSQEHLLLVGLPDKFGLIQTTINTNLISNAIVGSGGLHGLLIQGVNGVYSDITMELQLLPGH